MSQLNYLGYSDKEVLGRFVKFFSLQSGCLGKHDDVSHDRIASHGRISREDVDEGESFFFVLN